MGAVGVRSREKQRHRAALGNSEERCALRSDSVHHRTHVVHSLLKRRNG